MCRTRNEHRILALQLPAANAAYVICTNILPPDPTKSSAVITTVATSPSARSARLGLRATPEQEVVLRRAADVAHKSLTDFILDSACLAAEQTLLDQRLFMVSGDQYQAFMDLLEEPEQPNDGLRDLFSRKAPWTAK
jgi:uncharacterized protein (DUF1778 family)